MKTASAVVAVALVAQSNAFFAPTSTGLARTTRAARSVAPMRMQSSNNSAGDNVKNAAEKAKNAAKDGLHKAENAADRVNDKVQGKADQAQNKADEIRSDSRSSTTTSSQSSSSNVGGLNAKVSGGTEIRASDIQGKEVIREAPLTAVHIHEQETIVDKTKVEEERIKTEVVQKVQPIHDEERRAEQVKTVDHGTEIRHQGSSGIDAATQAELERRRKELEATTGATKDVTRKEISERPEVVRNEQTRVIEQVVPVLDKDIYVPKREEHEKKIVNVIHESPEIVGTQVEQTISKEEFEKKYGTKVDVTGASAAAAAADAKTVSASTRTTGTTTTSSNPMSNAATSANTSAQAAAQKAAATTGTTQKNVNYTPDTKQSTYISEHERVTGSGPTAGVTTTGGPKTGAAHDEPAPYSMSSSNMAKQAEEAEEEEGSGTGIGSKIKNAIKSIVD
jgi:hypothetical protein